MNSLTRILKKYVFSYKKEIFVSALFNILYALFSSISIISLSPVLDMLFGGKEKQLEKLQQIEAESSRGTFAETKYKVYLFINESIDKYGPLKFLAYLCIISILMFFFKNLFRYLAQYYVSALRTNVGRDIRIDLYSKIISLPVFYFTERKKGDILTRMSSDVAEVENTFLVSVSEFVRTPFAIIFTLISLFLISAKLTLMALLVLPVMAWVISSIGKSLKRQARQGLIETGNILSQVDETLNANKIIKIFNAEELLKKRFRDTAERLRKMASRVMQKYELASPTSEFLGSITMIIIVWYGGFLIIENKALDPTSFLVFIGLFFILLEPAKTLSSSISNLHKVSASTDRLIETLDTEEELKEIENPINIDDFRDSIKFNNVSFLYNEDKQIFKNLNFVIPKGKMIALVGQSGSGKTTIANLLARFYDVTEGEILVDGEDIRNLKTDDYRKQVGMVTQKSVLFNDTVLNNIRLSNPNATLDQVIEAAKVANALEFIENLPNGFDETVGEGGDKLSGGQQQRICIARAVLKNPPIMILDEATSALDTQSERLVQQAIENLMSNRTSIVIAHRLSTIQNADMIIVMDKGKIIEQGTHTKLIDKNGMYKHLIDMQNFS